MAKASLRLWLKILSGERSEKVWPSGAWIRQSRTSISQLMCWKRSIIGLKGLLARGLGSVSWCTKSSRLIWFSLLKRKCFLKVLKVE